METPGLETDLLHYHLKHSSCQDLNQYFGWSLFGTPTDFLRTEARPNDKQESSYKRYDFFYKMGEGHICSQIGFRKVHMLELRI